MSPKRSLLGRLDDTGIPLLVIRLVVGGFFVYSAGAKLIADPAEFQKAVKLYDVLPLSPPQLVNVTAIVIPWLELACGIALLAGLMVRGAAVIVLGLMTVFTAALYMHTIKLLNEGRFATFCDVSFDCGCGTGKQWMCTKIPVNLALLVLALLGVLSHSRRYCLSSRWLGRGTPSSTSSGTADASSAPSPPASGKPPVEA